MAKISKEEYKLLKFLGNRREWIARDERDSDLFAHRLKPIKQENGWLNVSSEYDFLCTRYFQFIKWEDDEPHNIAELIEEYESEETEVKKDLEWLKREVKKLEDKANKRNEFGSEYTDEEVALENVVLLLNQLDEPEVLSQEWIDEHEIHYNHWVGAVPVTVLQNLLVPKQELPVVPQFVADTIENRKGNMSLYSTLDDLNNKLLEESQWREWNEKRFGHNGHGDAQELIARAWLDGFTVEEEQKYNVKFKVKSSFGTVGIFLYKKGDEVLAGDNFRAYYPKEDEYRLTEQEIRDFQNGDILFEHFAVKVEGLEE